MGHMFEVVQKAPKNSYIPWLPVQKVHTPDDVKPPHLLFSKQTITVSKAAQSKLGYNPNKFNDTYINNWETWCALAEFGLTHDLIPNEICLDFLEAPMNSVRQGNSLIKLSNTCLDSLGRHLGKTTEKHVEAIEACGLIAHKKLMQFCKSSFSHTITLHISDDTSDIQYGGDEAVSGLRLEGIKGLNVFSIDCLKDAPNTLKQLAGILLNRIVCMGDKTLSSEIVAIHSDMDGLSELVDTISKKGWLEIEALIQDEQEYDVIFNCVRKHGVDVAELLEYWEEEELISKLSDINLTRYDYLNNNKTHQHDHTATISEMNKNIADIRKSTNPLVAHPLFKQIEKLTFALDQLYQPVDMTNFKKHGSDNYLGEYSVVAVDIEEENEWLKSHNSFLNDNGEVGSELLNISHPDIIKHLENNLLCDLLLCAFDIDMD